MKKKKENKYNKICDKFEKLEKHLEEMHKSIANIKHQCETAEFSTEELDVFADFDDLFTPDVPVEKE